jgi:hypothetical protein
MRGVISERSIDEILMSRAGVWRGSEWVLWRREKTHSKVAQQLSWNSTSESNLVAESANLPRSFHFLMIKRVELDPLSGFSRATLSSSYWHDEHSMNGQSYTEEFLRGLLIEAHK